MDYLQRPIDVQRFDQHFRSVRGEALKGTVLIAFTQTVTRWSATYQDAEISMTFRGNVNTLFSHMDGQQKEEEF